MKHLTVEQLKSSAEVHRESPLHTPLPPRERLERWAQLLESDPQRRLSTLFETEHALRPSRDAMRCDDSPLSVAFADPVLREEGLENDTYGAARRFFHLTDTEMHRVTCYCLNGSKISGDTAARLIRTTRTYQGPGAVARAFSWMGRKLGWAN